MLVVTPHLDLPPAATVGVTGAFFQPGAVTVQECTVAWAAAPDLTTAADSCGAAKTVTAAGDGTFSATASVTDPLVTRSGTSVPCGASGCVLVASSASDPAVTRALLVFGGPSLRVGQTQGLLDEQEVPITITGVEPGTVVDVGLCVTPAPGSKPTAPPSPASSRSAPTAPAEACSTRTRLSRTHGSAVCRATAGWSAARSSPSTATPMLSWAATCR